MRRAAIMTGLAALLAWSGYWLWLYLTAPVPDEPMQGLAAILIGATVPLILLSALLIYGLARWFFRRP